jgi:hypothetical protein
LVGYNTHTTDSFPPSPLTPFSLFQSSRSLHRGPPWEESDCDQIKEVVFTIMRRHMILPCLLQIIGGGASFAVCPAAVPRGSCTRYYLPTKIDRLVVPSTRTYSTSRLVSSTRMRLSQNNGQQENDEEEEEDEVYIVRGGEDDELSKEAWENVEGGKPSEFAIMKEVRRKYDD